MDLNLFFASYVSNSKVKERDLSPNVSHFHTKIEIFLNHIKNPLTKLYILNCPTSCTNVLLQPPEHKMCHVMS